MMVQNNDSASRLDRVEEFLERFEQSIEADRATSNERLLRLEQLQDSNSRSIQALTDALSADRQERKALEGQVTVLVNVVQTQQENMTTLADVVQTQHGSLELMQRSLDYLIRKEQERA
jgi:uncharacterized coiled-coil protein SlyX